MPAHRLAGVLQLSAAAAIALACTAAHGGGAGGALAGAGSQLSDFADQQLEHDAAMEQIRLHHDLEMQRMQRAFQEERQAQELERQRRAAAWRAHQAEQRDEPVDWSRFTPVPR